MIEGIVAPDIAKAAVAFLAKARIETSSQAVDLASEMIFVAFLAKARIETRADGEAIVGVDQVAFLAKARIETVPSTGSS